jgi:hypothetical protein
MLGSVMEFPPNLDGIVPNLIRNAPILVRSDSNLDEKTLFLDGGNEFPDQEDM